MTNTMTIEERIAALPRSEDEAIAAAMQAMAYYDFTEAESDAIEAEMRSVFMAAQHIVRMEYVRAGVVANGDGTYIIVGGR